MLEVASCVIQLLALEGHPYWGVAGGAAPSPPSRAGGAGGGAARAGLARRERGGVQAPELVARALNSRRPRLGRGGECLLVRLARMFK